MLESLVIVALIVEALVKVFTGFYVEGKIMWTSIIATVLGVLVALLLGIDLFTLAGMTVKYPIIAIIMSGILIGRGSDFVRELYNILKGQAEVLSARAASLR